MAAPAPLTLSMPAAAVQRLRLPDLSGQDSDSQAELLSIPSASHLEGTLTDPNITLPGMCVTLSVRFMCLFQIVRLRFWCMMIKSDVSFIHSCIQQIKHIKSSVTSRPKACAGFTISVQSHLLDG